MRQFPAILRGVTIDWFTSTDPQKLNSWNNIKKEFLAEFQLLCNDNEIVGEIFNTKQGKNETIHVYAKKLKDLINKMENKPANELQKRWFVEGLRTKLRKIMKIVPPLSYMETYNRALNLESEQRTKKKKNSSSDSDDDESSREDSSDDENSSKKVRALQKDMIRMMKELKNLQKETKGSELWCTECKTDGHTKGSCPKNQFCDICQIMGHSTKECPFNMKTRGSPQVLTQAASTSGGNGNANIDGATSDGWCGPGDHEDAKCPKSGVNLITVGTDEEEVLAITRRQAKVYPDPVEEKRKLGEVAEIEKALQAETSQLKDIIGTLARNFAEQNIVRQILQTEVPVKISDHLLTMPQLRMTILNYTPFPKVTEDTGKDSSATTTDPMLLALTTGRHPAVVEMGILGNVLIDTIVDGGSGVNVFPEDTWKKLGKRTLWPPAFQLLTADQHGIKPLGTLRAQSVTIGMQPFLLDFVVIPLKRKGYDAILGRNWLVQAKVKHDWKRNTLSMERRGKRFIIDLHTQMVGEEAASSNSEGEGESDDKGNRRMEPDEEGILRLEGGSNADDDLDSVNGLFCWQIEDYELFPSCNMLKVDEGEKTKENECPKEYREAEEGKAVMAEAKGKNIHSKPRKKKDPTIRYTVNGPHRKKRMHCTIKLVEGCRQQGNNLDAQRSQAQWATKVTQNRREAWHDKHLKLCRLQPGQLVLKYDGRNEIKSEKVKTRWVGPYQIQEVGDNGVIKLGTLDGQEVPHTVNESNLKIYHARKSSSSSQNDQMTPSSSSLQNGDASRQN